MCCYALLLHCLLYIVCYLWVCVDWYALVVVCRGLLFVLYGCALFVWLLVLYWLWLIDCCWCLCIGCYVLVAIVLVERLCTARVLLVDIYWLLVIGCVLVLMCYCCRLKCVWLFFVECDVLIVIYWMFRVCDLLIVICCLLFDVCGWSDNTQTITTIKQRSTNKR